MGVGLRSGMIAVAMTASLVAGVGGAASAAEDSKAKLVPVKIELPEPGVIGTRKDFKPNEHQEPPPPPEKPFPPFLAPEGSRNVALNKPVTGSDSDTISGDLGQITDGDKQWGSHIELATGRQWVQIDLQANHQIHGISVWHYFKEPRYYHDVVVQVADDPDFITNVRTLFNNDYDNSSGLGIGKDLEYLDTHHGRQIQAKDVAARYVRLYSKGSTDNEHNHYVEVEVYGKPAP